SVGDIRKRYASRPHFVLTRGKVFRNASFLSPENSYALHSSVSGNRRKRGRTVFRREARCSNRLHFRSVSVRWRRWPAGFATLPVCAWPSTGLYRVVRWNRKQAGIRCSPLNICDGVGGLSHERVRVLALDHHLQFGRIPFLPDDRERLVIPNLTGRNRARESGSLRADTVDGLRAQGFLHHICVVARVSALML